MTQPAGAPPQPSARQLTAEDFNALFAGGLHDAKNLLALLLAGMENLPCDRARPELASLLQRGQRINDKLVQLLSLYRMAAGNYPINVEHHSVSEFLEDCQLEFQPLLRQGALSLRVSGSEDLFWFFDRTLCSGMIINALHSSLAHARHEITLSAFEEDGSLVIEVADDGPGFPEAMLADDSIAPVSRAENRTGLGLHFSRIGARLHKNRGRTGEIRLQNRLGAVFQLRLP